jgi:predicted transcriptional regulator YdeE
MYAYIYFEWIKKSSYEFSNDMIMELYDEEFNFHEEKGSMSILVPIRKKQ